MKREPVRTCVGCRMRDSRSSLVRVVAALGGARIDPSAAAPGRGAWVHPARACLELAGRPGALGAALRTGLAGDEVGRLMLEIERMGAA